jgi:CRP/FNR family cyclic AMP-dependent transcriptional regulator
MSDENISDDELWETLRGLEFLRGVADEHVKELASLSKVVDFPEGTIVFSEGEPALHCYLIVDGSVLLEICGPAGCTPILTVGEGELLGWSPVLGAAQLTSTARTRTSTRAIQLSGRELLTLCEQIPEFGYQFMRCTALALAKRLTATRLQLLDLYGAETGGVGKRQ